MDPVFLYYCYYSIVSALFGSSLLYILMDFSPPSEDSKSLGKLQSIYVLHKLAVKYLDNVVLIVYTEINIYIYILK